MTDAIGMEETPAVSPDEEDLAFVASVNGRRQIWIRRLAGGPAMQITNDGVDHEYPRWTPDSNAIVYFTPAEKEDQPGMLYEVPRYGGPPRGLAPSSTGADVSRDGRLATFQKIGAGVAFAIMARDGRISGQTIPIDAAAVEVFPPRWSHDARSIAFYTARGIVKSDLFVIDVATGAKRQVSTGTPQIMKGVAWLPDGNGLVFASSAGSTMAYPPVFNLRWVSQNGGRERQLTVGDVSYEHPDIAQTGQLFATRVFTKSEIWRFPVSGSPVENVTNATQITRQTGQVQTPSASPDGKKVAYLSDSGGHANLWVTRIDGFENRHQVTTENDDRTVVGIPIWSPVDDRIVFIQFERVSDRSTNTQWLVNSDGSDRRLLVKGASSAAWSVDGRWLYYQSEPPACIFKVRVDGNAPPERVRCDAAVPAPGGDRTLYFAPGRWQNATAIYKAKPENAESAQLVASFPVSRVPLWPIGFALSPDGRWIAMPLKDRGTTNIWAIPTDGGVYRQITDFGRRPTLIARQVSWSRDGKFIFAALAESDADIVLLEGISQRAR